MIRIFDKRSMQLLRMIRHISSGKFVKIYISMRLYKFLHQYLNFICELLYEAIREIICSCNNFLIDYNLIFEKQTA